MQLGADVDRYARPMDAAVSPLAVTLLGVGFAAVLALFAWLFRSWANGLSEDIGQLRGEVKGQTEAVRDWVGEVDARGDRHGEQIARIEGVMNLPPWPPRGGVQSSRWGWAASRRPPGGQSGRRPPGGS